MTCSRCGQAEPTAVPRAKLSERDGRVAVVLDVPMRERFAVVDVGLADPLAHRLGTEPQLVRDPLGGSVVGDAAFEAARRGHQPRNAR